MKITGVGPKIGFFSSAYLIAVILIHFFTYPSFIITQHHYTAALIIGIILFLTGAVLLLLMARKLKQSFSTGFLMTDGLYRVFRNPMYAMYLIFTIPGLALIFNSWIILTTIIVMYVLLRIHIKEEYEYLAAKYGAEYDDYLKKVWFKFL